MVATLSGRFPIPDATPQNPHRTTTLVRKSRFLAQACHCDSRDAARGFLEYIRSQNSDATHNCWAFVAGAPGDTAHIGCSDDGEPRGTAGKPMLNALLHCGTGQICMIVSRWFGGIKLGTGGLARAYQEAVLENLKTLPLTVAVPMAVWHVRADYEWLPRIKRLLPDYEARLTGEEYGEIASLAISAPEDKGHALDAALSNLTNGKIRLRGSGLD